MWEQWRPQEDAPPLETYTVITTVANKLLEPIHERMPAILGESDWEVWLDPDMSNPLLLRSMLQPCPEEWLEWEVA